MQEWVLDGRKFLTNEEIVRLKKACRPPAGEAGTEREELIINLGLLAGLRVKEIAGLKCGDIWLETQPATLIIRNGKGGKMRLVRFNGALKESFIKYLNEKEVRGEVTGTDDPLFKSDANNGHISRRTVQRVFERAAGRAGISGHSFHHLRHTYASHLYRAGNYNLRLVQKQLGHSSIKTTQVYADVFDEDLTKAVENLYKTG